MSEVQNIIDTQYQNGKKDPYQIIELIARKGYFNYRDVLLGNEIKEPGEKTCVEFCNSAFGKPEFFSHKLKNLFTLSEKFRRDMMTYFGNKSRYKILELGCHYGYSTSHFANIFKKVYTLDWFSYFLGINREINREKDNIIYLRKDLYKETWDDLYELDVDIVFLDAMHTKECVEKDLKNILKFKNLKYVIVDDYGMWKGVREPVEELVKKGILKREIDFGLTRKELIMLHYENGTSVDLKLDSKENEKKIENIPEGVMFSINLNK